MDPRPNVMPPNIPDVVMFEEMKTDLLQSVGLKRTQAAVVQTTTRNRSTRYHIGLCVKIGYTSTSKLGDKSLEGTRIHLDIVHPFFDTETTS